MTDALQSVLLDPNAEPIELSLLLLKDITNDFSDDQRIDIGGFAAVYKGRLRNGAVAVKKLSQTLSIHEKKFQQEVASLMRMKHTNIVRFLGYCSDTQEKLSDYSNNNAMLNERERLLCFEFLPRGSLDKYITDESCGLDWHERYDIILGICSGLHYLHTKRSIAYMDLKPENILLDHNMAPKIADFGTLIDQDKSFFTKNFTGISGYMAPEYNNGGPISKRADIFSFGVIILELMTGSRPNYPLSEESAALFANEVAGKWRDRLSNAAYSQQVRMCALIAIKCVCSDKYRRPTTGCIIKILNEVQDSNFLWYWVKTMTPDVAIGIVAAVLILASVVAIILVYQQHRMSSWPWVILFAIGAVPDAVLILLNPSSSCYG
ncbi:putative receptor-like protein kinase At4g00960 [Setaria italica]|uniref:putative receptor-like protein kinase At4g00960 n=1 Tax=Setaria italica TaxID=4555 RepID=UPI000BE55469|nr:putative receptor-like protein kinase At4g00960 [Setaria italica]